MKKKKSQELLIAGSQNSFDDCTLKISHLVKRFMNECLREWWRSPKIALLVPKQDFYLWIVVTPKSRDKLVVTETDQIKEGLDAAIWLPVDKIRAAENYLGAYLQYYFEGLKILFAQHQLPVEDLDKIHEQIVAEVMDNPKYAYQSSWKASYDKINDKPIIVWE
ncbi:MAG: hypothetical protein EAZ97_01515 [Bacteroidetes bacterium]|nr:MAG: hypothetical protein EAZ97_01515 [Bacteroidota bacterium]